jgi:DNA modification methylase
MIDRKSPSNTDKLMAIPSEGGYHQFDVEFANEIAHLESFNKHLYRPNSYLHKWWARRCGTTFRLLLQNLVGDSNRKTFYSAGGLEGKLILDPMIGGGTTLHEAIRLGANVIGYDIDPIPILQAKASLNSIELSRLKPAYSEFHSRLEKRIGPLFVSACPKCDEKSELRFTIHGLKKRCQCRNVIIVDSYILREESAKEKIRICPDCLNICLEENCYCEERNSSKILVEKKEKVCPICETQYATDRSIPYYTRFTPIANVGECKSHGLYFSTFSKEDRSILAEADKIRKAITFDSELSIQPGPKSSALIRQGIEIFPDLFSSRQLLYIKNAAELLPEFDKIERLYLGLMVSTSLEFNSMLCGYKGAKKRRAGAIRHVFAYHAYSFPHTVLENNPIYSKPASGTLQKLYKDKIRRARIWAMEPRERNIDGSGERFVPIHGEVDYGIEVEDPNELTEGTRKYLLKQGSATKLSLASNSVDFVVTDPPYYDSVQYSDLANFFRVWLRQFVANGTIRNIDWDYSTERSAVSSTTNSGSDVAHHHYQNLLTEIMAECFRVLRKEEGRLILSFHHWDYRAWAALTVALKQANFYLISRWVVHSENPSSVHIARQNSLSHDALLTFSPGQPKIRCGWQIPEYLDKTDSARFCTDCSNLLGWILESEQTAGQIPGIWKSVMSHQKR